MLRQTIYWLLLLLLTGNSAVADIAPSSCLTTALSTQEEKLCLGRDYLKSSRHEDALRVLKQSHRLAKQFDDYPTIIGSALLLADIYALRNQLQQAFSVLTHAYEIAAEHQLSADKETVLNALATAYYSSGRFDLAEKYYQDLLAQQDQSIDSSDLSVTLFNLAHAYASQGKHDQADQAFRRSYDISRSLDDKMGTAYTLKAWGENANATGDLALARQRFEQAQALFKDHGHASQQGAVLRHLGDISVKQGRYVEASVFYLAAIPVLEQQGFEHALLRSYRGLAGAYAGAGDYRQAFLAQELYLTRLQASHKREKNASSQRLQAEFETRFNTQKLADSNAQLSLKNAKQQKEIEYDRLWRTGLSLIALLALLVSSLLWLVWKRGKKHTATMEHFATTDELTQISNRRSVLEYGETEWQRFKDSGERFSVLILDIDHFKRINDNFGHAAGDIVLKGVVETAQTALRKSDKLGRYGGEEFLIITTDIALVETMKLAERVRIAVAARQFEVIGNGAVTISIGVAQPDGADSLNELIGLADKALYEAKETGRNRVCQFVTTQLTPA